MCWLIFDEFGYDCSVIVFVPLSMCFCINSKRHARPAEALEARGKQPES